MREIEDTYWWFVARRKLVVSLIRELNTPRDARLLDVGCGTGANLLAFQEYVISEGIDSSQPAIDYCARRGLQNVKRAFADALPYADETFDIVTALDVLEHCRDDIAVLSELRRVCKKGGRLILTVPAYGFLWSEHDEALQHFRRYTAHELRNKATVAGCTVAKSTYFITALFPVILALRIWQGLTKRNVIPQTALRQLSSGWNWLLIRLLDFERQLIRYFNLPVGVSFVMIAVPGAPVREFSISGDDSTEVPSTLKENFPQEHTFPH